MAAGSLYENVIAHLGGQARLIALGVRAYDTDDAHVSLRLLHPNPRGVRSVTITAHPGDLFEMECYGPILPDTFDAKKIGRAEGIAAENLAATLGNLTGVGPRF